MLFGDTNPKPAQLSVDSIRVRRLEPDEIRSLSVDQLIYVDSRQFESTVLVPAHIKPGNNSAYLESSTPTAPIRNIYGTEFHASFDEVFQADEENGEELPLIRTAGSRISASIFFTGIDGREAEERLRKALRAEFGSGIVEIWNMKSGPVQDLRFDVWESRSNWVPREGSKRGRNQEGSYEITEKRLLARGVRDGHQHHFVGKASPGWSILVELHQPDTSETEVL